MENSQCKEPWGISGKGCQKQPSIGFGLWLGDLGKGLRKQGLPLD